MFKKAERKQSKLRIGLMGPSGSGKTYTALLMAQGLGGKVALLDTERGSGSLYSHLAEYDVAEISAPFTPQKYIQVIREAEKAGYNVLIVDSLSHAWAGEGGLLDMQDAATKSSRSGNSFMAWREVTPHHNKLVDAILQSPMHIILTLRTKTAYEVQDDGRGKKVPVKIGLAPVFRDGIEYEATTVFDLSINHIATASKDRTGLFDAPFKPGKETGEVFRAWLDGAAPAPAPAEPAPETEQPAPRPATPPPAPTPSSATTAQAQRIAALCNGRDPLAECSTILGRAVKSSKEITEAEAQAILATLEAESGQRKDQTPDKPVQDMISESQRKKIFARGRELRMDKDNLMGRVNAWLEKNKHEPVESLNELTKQQASGLIDAMEKAEPKMDECPI